MSGGGVALAGVVGEFIADRSFNGFRLGTGVSQFRGLLVDIATRDLKLSFGDVVDDALL